MGGCVQAGPLTKITNQSIKTSKFPTNWKASKVCPVYKKGDRQTVKNYRPVSLLPLPGMICERVIAIQAEEFFEENKILQEFQFGFRRFKSTISEMLTLFDSLLEAKEQGKEIALVLFDLSCAFDTIDHDILCKKLKIYGWEENAIKWMWSYLKDRTQKVVISGQYSSETTVNRGCPQGSRLSPLLFSVLMSDLNLHTKKSKLTNFADDTQIHICEEK